MFFGAESALGFGVRDAPPLASVLRSSSLGGTYRVPPPPPFSQGVSHSSDSTGFFKIFILTPSAGRPAAFAGRPAAPAGRPAALAAAFAGRPPPRLHTAGRP